MKYLLRNKLIHQAILNRVPVDVHLISGETYCGICEEHEKPEVLINITGAVPVNVYYWAIKRVKFASMIKEKEKS